MNKLLSFPLAILLLFTLVYYGYSGIMIATGSSTGDLAPGQTQMTTELVRWGDYALDLTSVTGIVAIVVIATIISAFIGINFVATGFSTYTQRLVFNLTIFGGIWLALSVVMGQVFFSDTSGIFYYMWIALTVCYAIGFGAHVGGADLG